MTTATVRGHASKLRRICAGASLADYVPDHLPHDPVVVGDLPALTFTRIGASMQADRLACALREWIKEQS